MIIKAGCRQAGGLIGGIVGTAFGSPEIGKIIGKNLGSIIGSLVDTGAPEDFFSDACDTYVTQVAQDTMEFGFSPLDIF